MAITYTVATNVIQVTGYTEGTPCNFTDIYNADKAGTLSIHDRNAIPAVDGAAVAVDRALRPADYVVLGGSSGDLYITVANWTNMTTATIRITGTDRDGNAQTEDIVVNANGTFNTTKWFKTVTHTQVTVFTKSDSGSFDYELIQGQWGVVTRHCTNVFCFNDINLDIGDGSIVTWFADVRCIFHWGSSDTHLRVKSNAHFRLGIKNANGTTESGVSVFTDRNEGWYGLRLYPTGNAVVQLYNVCFLTDNVTTPAFVVEGESGTVEFIDCSLYRPVGIGYGKESITLTNVTLLKPHAAITIGVFDGVVTSYTITNLRVYNCTAHIVNISTAPSATFTQTIKGLVIVGTQPSNAIRWGYCIDSVLNLIDSVEIDPSKCLSSGTTTNNQLRNKKTFNLHVIDKDNNNLSNVSVEIWDSQNNKVVDVTTGADGKITEQELEYKRYRFSSGCSYSTTDYNPFAIQISKTGYESYIKTFTVDDATDWTIALHIPKRRFDSLEG